MSMKLYGKNPVLERIKASPRTIHKIYIALGHEEAGYVLKKAKKWGIPVVQVPASRIVKLARNVNTQGIVAEVGEFSYRPFEEFIEQGKQGKAILIFLDGITDPQNLGAIIRSLACLGEFNVVLPTHHAVDVTESVLRVACGGENYVPIAKVSNISQAIARAKEAGFWIVGAVTGGGTSLYDAGLQFPLGLVIGSEEKGIRETVSRHLDCAVTIPMARERLSLNAAQAATIFCYEGMRQKIKS